MENRMKLVKWLMFGFNLIFFILGLVLLGVGGYSRVKAKDYDSVLGESGSIANAANLLIAAGVFVALIGFIGCCGAVKNNKIMLGVFAALIILIFIIEIAAGALAYSKKDVVFKGLQKQLSKIVEKNYVSNPPVASIGVIKAMNWFQEHVQCCGVASADDWTASVWFRAQNMTSRHVELVPESCCKHMARGCSHAPPNEKPLNSSITDDIYTQGCYPAGKEFLKSKMWLLGGAGIGVAIVQLLGVVFALCLIKAINDDHDIV